MKNAFARDEHGNVKTKKGCQTPGCDHPNWHICLVGKPDTTEEILARRKKEKDSRGSWERTGRSDSHRQAISEAQKARWAKVREANAERDKKIVELYAKGDISVRALAEKFDLGIRVILRILKEAEAEGKVTVRKPGHNINRASNLPSR